MTLRHYLDKKDFSFYATFCNEWNLHDSGYSFQIMSFLRNLNENFEFA
jgi:hypothetical protein